MPRKFPERRDKTQKPPGPESSGDGGRRGGGASPRGPGTFDLIASKKHFCSALTEYWITFSEERTDVGSPGTPAPAAPQCVLSEFGRIAQVLRHFPPREMRGLDSECQAREKRLLFPAAKSLVDEMTLHEMRVPLFWMECFP